MAFAIGYIALGVLVGAYLVQRGGFVPYAARISVATLLVVGGTIAIYGTLGANGIADATLLVLFVLAYCGFVYLIDGEIRGLRHVLGLPSEMAIPAAKFSA